MELPCYICGYTTASNYGGTQILEYVDQDIDGKDKYRITGMASRGGTPTMPAMRYMGEKLSREQAEQRLLLVSTDGCSDGGRESIQQVIKDLRKKNNIIVIGAGIGSSRGSVEHEIGDNFIDISNRCLVYFATSSRRISSDTICRLPSGRRHFLCHRLLAHLCEVDTMIVVR